MADLVGLNARPPDYLGKLSQLLNIKGQQTELAGAQQSQRQRAALAAYDFNQHVGEDGTLDLNALSTDPTLRAAAGDQYLDVLTHAAAAKQQQLEAKSKLFSLRGQQVEGLGQMLSPLLQDPDVVNDTEKGRQKLNQAWMQYGQLHGDEALPVLQTFAAPLRNVPKGKLASALRMIQLQAADVNQQRAAMMPNLVNTGRQLQNVNPNVAADVPQSMGLSMPPTAQVLTDAAGRSYIVDPVTNQPRLVGGGRGAAPSASPSAPAFQQPDYQGQPADIESNQAEVKGIRAVADRAPTNRNIYKRILELSEQTNTGPLVKLAQSFGAVGQVAGDNFQELAKYLEKNAIENMTAMGGPPSDARLSAAVAANGSTGFNKKALQAVTRFNYATNTGMEMYRKGMDQAVGLEKPNYLKLPAFKAAWAQNFDIDALRMENAIRDGDDDARAEILRGMSKERAAELAQKMRNLEALSNTGKLP